MKNLLSAVLVVVVLGCGSQQAEPDHAAPSIVTSPEPVPASTDFEPAAPSEGRLVVGTDACTTDADCVPGGCCHPATCVSAATPPACGDVMCTTDCRYDTLDCGGSCLCHEGHCAARLSPPPAIPGLAAPQ